MFTFFRTSLDEPLPGSRAYLGSLQHIFVQDERSGVIEVQYAAGCQIFFLYSGGNLLRVYQVDEARSAVIAAEALGRYWDGGEAPIYQAELPNQAVRTIWQVMEWHPPSQVRLARCADVGSILEDYQAQGVEGLLRVMAPGVDGFIPLLAGSQPGPETILATATGLDEGLASLQHALQARAGQDCALHLYSAAPGSALDTLILRQAFVAWNAAVLERYYKMVGMNLVNALDYQVNTALRLKHFNLRLAGMRLVENHLFSTLEEAGPAYRYFLEQVFSQMKQVLGGALAERILADTFSKLDERSQRSLARCGLEYSGNREA